MYSAVKNCAGPDCMNTTGARKVTALGVAVMNESNVVIKDAALAMAVLSFESRASDAAYRKRDECCNVC